MNWIFFSFKYFCRPIWCWYRLYFYLFLSLSQVPLWFLLFHISPPQQAMLSLHPCATPGHPVHCHWACWRSSCHLACYVGSARCVVITFPHLLAFCDIGTYLRLILYMYTILHSLSIFMLMSLNLDELVTFDTATSSYWGCYCVCPIKKKDCVKLSFNDVQMSNMCHTTCRWEQNWDKPCYSWSLMIYSFNRFLQFSSLLYGLE